MAHCGGSGDNRVCAYRRRELAGRRGAAGRGRCLPIHPHDPGFQEVQMSARNTILAAAAATACTVLGAAGVTAGSANAAVRSAAGSPVVPGFAATGGPPTSAQCMKKLGIACYSPLQVERAYDLAPLYARGLDGKDRTIVIVDPFGSPTIRHDLRVFDRAFGLPAPPAFRVLQPVGPVPPFNPKNFGMVDKAAETTLDVEWGH